MAKVSKDELTVRRRAQPKSTTATDDDTAKRLSACGLNVTRARLELVQLFRAGQFCHLTAEEIHVRLRAAGVRVAIATVYRMVSQLTSVGILTRHMFEPGIAVYELQRDQPHDHLICLACGRVDEFSDRVIERRQQSVAKASGYSVAQHELALYGYCPDCRRLAPSVDARG